MEKKRKKQNKMYQPSLREQIKRKPGMFILYLALRVIVLAVMVAQFCNKDYQNVILCIFVLFLYTVPSFIENNRHIDIPDTLEVVVLIFIFAAEILGEIRAYFINVPFWDTALHTVTGFLAAAVGFSLVDILNRSESTSFNLSPMYVAITAFTFSMTIGVFWEFLEFGMDSLFGLDMQKDTIITKISSIALNSTGANRPIAITNIEDTAVNGVSLGINGYLDIGLIDTMEDLLVNFIGASVFSILGFFYLKNRKGRFLERFIPTRQKKTEAETKSESEK